MGTLFSLHSSFFPTVNLLCTKYIVVSLIIIITVGPEGEGEKLDERGSLLEEQNSGKGQQLLPPLSLIQVLIYIISILNTELFVSSY